MKNPYTNFMPKDREELPLQPTRIAACKDKTIAFVDELKCLPEDIRVIYSNTQMQVRSVHVIRHSLFYFSYKNRKKVATDLKMIYWNRTLDEVNYQREKFC